MGDYVCKINRRNKNNDVENAIIRNTINDFNSCKVENEYFLEISSEDTSSKNPFDITVKFQITNTNENGLKQAATINNKFNNVTYIEISDLAIPRYIPSEKIGDSFDGFILVKSTLKSNIITDSCNSTNELTNYLLKPNFGSNIVTGTVTLNNKIVNYIKIINNKKESTILLPHGYSENISLMNDKFPGEIISDHININNKIYPICHAYNNNIFIDNVSDLISSSLPTTTPLILPKGNILFTSNDLTFTQTSLFIPAMPIELIQNIYKDSILRIVDESNNNYYFIINNYAKITGINFTGTWMKIPIEIKGVCSIYLFGFGLRDLYNESKFFVELTPFKVPQATGTNEILNQMFGTFTHDVKGIDWLYLSSNSYRRFLPSNAQKLDTIVIRMYDSNKVPLYNVFKKQLGAYESSNNTSITIKIKQLENDLCIKN